MPRGSPRPELAGVGLRDAGTHLLPSPSPRVHDFSADGFNDWAFMTTHSWDEDPSGEWVLEIENTSDANNYGRAGPASPLPRPSPSLSGRGSRVASRCPLRQGVSDTLDTWQ